MGCEVLNFALKRLIREERPQSKRDCSENVKRGLFSSLPLIDMHGKGYGMPSSHAQFVAYFSCYASLFLLLRHRPNFSVTPQALTYLQRTALSFLACVGASAVAISRLYLSYHTKKQVLVGFAAGVLFSIAWFSFTSYLRTFGWIDWALDLSLSRALRFRDLVVSEDLTEAGWQRWEAQRKLKRREHSETAHKSD